jgi:serine/threonine protein phosphatase PrpC
MLALEVALLSDRGGRKYNEDACGHWHSERDLVCVLADGAGGHGGGDIAARLAVSEVIGRFCLQPSRDGADLGGLLRATNLELIEQREPGTPRADMHSTVVCLVIDFVDRRAHWAHAGDSRLYWFRDARILERTRDHSLVQNLVDSGVIAESEVRSHPRRSELRSALGIPDELLEVGSRDGALAVEPGDVFLLCTDGLWEYVDDAELEQSLQSAAGPAAWLERLDAAVRRNARHRASHDNFSALVVWAGAAP